jgi:ABC-2 type transport system permease protein
MFGQISALVIKEFLAVWRDKRSRSVLILPPLIQLFIFSFAVTLEVSNISVGFYNQDQGQVSYEVIQRIKGSPKFTNYVFLEKDADITKAIEEQEVLLVVQIPADFSRKISQGESGKLQLLLDGRRSNASSIASGYINEIVRVYNEELAKAAKRKLATSTLVTRHWFNPNLEYKWYTVPSLIAVLSMVIALVLTSLSVAREREMGTFEQLLVSPVSPRQILIGKTIPALLLSLAESTVILFLSVYAFGIKFQGSVLWLYASMLVFLLAVVGIGLFISSLCKTQQQAVLGTFVFMVPSVNLSGFATPVENMPDWLQHVSDLIPLKHFLIVVKGLFLKNVPLDVVFANTWPNMLIALFTLSMAGWLFRRRME